ncbi:MAG: hypothetical protein P8Y25_01850 [Chromatiaceae bacterium]
MARQNTFKVLLLIARPAAGKSEIIDYLKHTPLTERMQRFHIGEFEEIDDFPMLWAWFEEDQLLEQMGYPRLHTDAQGMFIGHHLWDLLIERISLEYHKKLRDDPDYHQRFTTILEFSRGKEHGGFKRALKHLSREIVEKMAVLYVQVSWEESLRKNRARFNPERPDSILEHSLPDERLELLYKESDWQELSAQDPQYLTIQGLQVPYAVFDNEDDVTTQPGPALGARLEKALDNLWRQYRSSRRQEGKENG